MGMLRMRVTHGGMLVIDGRKWLQTTVDGHLITGQVTVRRLIH